MTQPNSKQGECIEWTGALDKHGYGVVSIDRKTFRVHRLAVILSGRRYPKGYVTDHLCRNRKCINPDHLDVVTNVVNIMRGQSFGALNALKTHCPYGHILDGIRISPLNKKRRWKRCRKCNTLAYRKRRYAKRQKAKKR